MASAVAEQLMAHDAIRVGGASLWKGAWRVGFWGAFAMAMTAWVGTLFGAAV